MSDFLPSAEAIAGNPAAAIVLFFALVIGHAVADFALQPDFLAIGKNRHADLSKFFGEQNPPQGLWIHALSAHSLIHAGAVWLVTGSVVLSAVELVLHFIIDFAKGEGKTSFGVDQALHYACKAAYIAILYFGCSCLTWSPV